MEKFNLVGQRFGRLTVIAKSDIKGKKDQDSRWVCLCDCGIRKVVRKGTLGRTTQSCGCLRRENASTAKKHGHSRKGATTREYYSWQRAKDRCYNPRSKKYQIYGARGITMCPEWRDNFEAFLRDMGECPEAFTLERKDVNKGYSKDNCKWASRLEQANNTRRNRYIEYEGERYTVAQLARKLCLNSKAFDQRIRNGQSLELAISRSHL